MEIALSIIVIAVVVLLVGLATGSINLGTKPEEEVAEIDIKSLQSEEAEAVTPRKRVSTPPAATVVEKTPVKRVRKKKEEIKE